MRWGYHCSSSGRRQLQLDPHEVKLYTPSTFFVIGVSLTNFVCRASILTSVKNAESIKLVVCKMNERACHGWKGYDTDFFYMYSIVFRYLGVLCALNLAPTQLHPNEWAYMQTFTVIYTAFALTPTPASFLYFIRALPHPNKSWVSLSPVKDRKLFTLFNTSLKDFKTNFFKVSIKEVGRSSFYSDEN